MPDQWYDLIFVRCIVWSTGNGNHIVDQKGRRVPYQVELSLTKAGEFICGKPSVRRIPVDVFVYECTQREYRTLLEQYNRLIESGPT